MKEDEGDLPLAAELDEVGAFEGGCAEEDAVVGYYADFVAINMSKSCDKSASVVTLELREHTSVYYPGDDFVDRHRFPEIRAGDTNELFRIV